MYVNREKWKTMERMETIKKYELLIKKANLATEWVLNRVKKDTRKGWFQKASILYRFCTFD